MYFKIMFGYAVLIFQSHSLAMVWWFQVFRIVRVYAPWVLLPVTMTIGFIGYNLETAARTRYGKTIEQPKSIEEQRQDRRLKEMNN